MSTSEKRFCKTCRFVGVQSGGKLRCYRFPPTPVVMGHKLLAVYVSVDPNEGCYEWQAGEKGA